MSNDPPEVRAARYWGSMPTYMNPPRPPFSIEEILTACPDWSRADLIAHLRGEDPTAAENDLENQIARLTAQLEELRNETP